MKLKHTHSLYEKNKKDKKIHNHQGHMHDRENNPFLIGGHGHLPHQGAAKQKTLTVVSEE